MTMMWPPSKNSECARQPFLLLRFNILPHSKYGKNTRHYIQRTTRQGQIRSLQKIQFSQRCLLLEQAMHQPSAFIGQKQTGFLPKQELSMPQARFGLNLRSLRWMGVSTLLLKPEVYGSNPSLAELLFAVNRLKDENKEKIPRMAHSKCLNKGLGSSRIKEQYFWETTMQT